MGLIFRRTIFLFNHEKFRVLAVLYPFGLPRWDLLPTSLSPSPITNLVVFVNYAFELFLRHISFLSSCYYRTRCCGMMIEQCKQGCGSPDGRAIRGCPRVIWDACVSEAGTGVYPTKRKNISNFNRLIWFGRERPPTKGSRPPLSPWDEAKETSHRGGIFRQCQHQFPQYKTVSPWGWGCYIVRKSSLLRAWSGNLLSWKHNIPTS